MIRTLTVALALALTTGAAFAESLVFDCQPKPGVDICRSHYTIDSNTRVVDMWFCDPPTIPLAPDPEIDDTIYATIGPDLITFYDKFSGSHFELNRSTLVMTLTKLTEASGEPFESSCTKQ